ncbi:MAG: ABC transporter ATP-binding protein [Eubacteriales bacterium]|nr:ABC transporter ATP-binding protein [Eubacteriales bacterium]
MPHSGRMTTQKAKDFKGTMRSLLAELGRYKFRLIAVIVFAVLSTIFNIAGPKVLAKATTALATGWVAKLRGTGSIDFGYIGKILLILLAMYLVSAAFSFCQSWIMSGLSQKMCYDFRRQISEKINRLPLAYFEKRTVGEVLSRITNDVDTLGQSLNQSITQLITSITTMIGVLIMMLTISPTMTLIAILILPVSMALVLLVVRFSQKYFRAQQKVLGSVNGQVEEVYSGHNVVKAFNREDAVLNDFDEANNRLFESAWKSQFLSGLMQPIMTFVGNLGYVAVAVSGSIFAARGIITIGDIQAFIQYVRNFTQPIQQLAQVSNMLQSMAAASERVFEFLGEPEEEQNADPARRADPACIDGQVTFDHVKFGYTPEKTVIRDFSCDVKPGQKVAIVGPTGAGKTTMVKLLMRFYDVNSGAITLDGHNVKDFDRSALREGFGMVLQDTWLFQGTIMENIRYGRLDATDEEVIAAAKAACADHFIRTLPGGYQMELNEDASNVSQGQKQLLTIARAILADNKILILDEATSSVDTRTEQRIQTAMDNLMRGRTSFVIAHRLSTIKDADLILVMRDGDIVEQGTHDDLLAAGGFYADLYNSQFEDVSA